jgi:Phasin protein
VAQRIAARSLRAKSTRWPTSQGGRHFERADVGLIKRFGNDRKTLDAEAPAPTSGFDRAKSLAGAKNFAETVELQTAHWRKQFDALTAEAEEVRTLSTKVTADVGPFP